ncbi:hypothetical protein ACPOL_4422 [Acidisarcina polymorpha]|uniref:Uncharacterized protein n=1 Tax=Acidisarcina polymorpha TaxID=2211140 RepID=A0A2Z5G4V3_9BACT|nr:hypothetical protein [Acidisarcina polymorpha]AXC13695.1 hypothetical protein ACPOL_4422 [Acidisarcina polymorpha]
MRIAHITLASAVSILSLSASAQSLQQQSWAINIPFDFTVRSANLEAGRYIVRQSGPVVFLTARNGKTASMLTNRDYAKQPASQSSLVFKREDGEYALAQVRTAGSNTQLDAVVGKHVHKQMEALNSSQVVEVAVSGTR